MATVLDKTNQPPPVPPGSIVYVIIDPSGTPADRKATIEALAASTAFSDVYAVQADLPQAAVTPDVVPDAVSSPGDLLWQLGEEIGTDHAMTVRLGQVVRLVGARLATIAALPTVTYGAGMLGEGATLTATANGALADIDFTTPALGDWIMVAHQAAPLQNGVYEVTTLGTAGTPFVLTRVPATDLAADYAGGIIVEVSDGTVQHGRRFSSYPRVVTMGTTSIQWERDAQPEKRRRFGSDFATFGTDIVVATSANQIVPGTEFVTSLVGTATKVSQPTGVGTDLGVLQLHTGSTATGLAGIGHGYFMGGGFTFATATSRFDFFARCGTPVVSTGAQEHTSRIGLLNNTLTLWSDVRGMFFEFPADGSTIKAVCRVGSTPTTVDTGSAMSSSLRTMAIRYNETTGEARFYLAGALVATITTNLPVGSVIPGASILKSVGTTDAILQVDQMWGKYPEPRGNMALIPT